MRNLHAKDFNLEVVKNELAAYRNWNEGLRYLPSEFEEIMKALVTCNKVFNYFSKRVWSIATGVTSTSDPYCRFEWI